MTRSAGFIIQISSDTVVIEKIDRTTETIDRQFLPALIQIGDYVKSADATHYVVDKDLTERRRLERRRMTENYLE